MRFPVYVAVIAVLSLGAAFGARAEVAVPHFRNVVPAPTKPVAGAVRVVRFLMGADYPPFQFIQPNGEAAGYHADLARAICTELTFSCTLQAWKWDELVPALKEQRADALIAAIRPTPERRGELTFTAPYFRLPARFVVRRDAPAEISPAALANRRVAAVSGSAHEAYLKAFFGGAELVSVQNVEEGRTALQEKRADALFADGATLALWLQDGDGEACCAFAGGAYLESRFFGEGLAIALRPEDEALRDLIDHALDELETRGVLGDLYLKWFPLGIY